MISDQKTSLTSRVSLLMFAKTVGFVFSLALPLILARRMDPTQVGLYKQAFQVVMTAVLILPMGLGMSAYYFLPREPTRGRSTVLNIVLFHFLTGGLGFLALLLYPGLLDLIFRNSGLVSFAPLIGLIIFLWIFGSFLEIVPIAHGEVKLATIFIICVQGTRAIVFVLAALLFGDVRSLLYAGVAHGLFLSCFLLFYLHSRFPGFWGAFDWEMLRIQLSYALPLGLVGLLQTVQTDLHNYVVSNRFGPAMFAVYSFGTMNLPLIGLLQEAVGAVLIPSVGVLQQQDKHREIVDLIARAMRKLAAVYFPIYAFLIVTGREFIAFLFTEQYRASWPIFAVNLTLLPLSILLRDPLFRAYQSQRYFLVRVRIATIGVLVAALWVGVSHFGLMGAIWAVVGANILEIAVTTARFARLIGITRKDIALLKDVGKLAFAALIAGLAAALTRLFVLGMRPVVVLMVCGIFFVLVYVLAVLVLRIMTGGEKQLIRSQLASVFPQTIKPTFPL